MKLIGKFGLAALLVALLAVPALARHQGGTSKPETTKQKLGGIEGESTDHKHPDEFQTQKGSQGLPYNVKGESPQPSERKAGKGSEQPQKYFQYKMEDIYISR